MRMLICLVLSSPILVLTAQPAPTRAATELSATLKGEVDAILVKRVIELRAEMHQAVDRVLRERGLGESDQFLNELRAAISGPARAPEEVSVPSRFLSLGVLVEPVSDSVRGLWSLPIGEGELVVRVQRESPLHAAGLREGAVVLRVEVDTVGPGRIVLAAPKGSTVLEVPNWVALVLSGRSWRNQKEAGQEQSDFSLDTWTPEKTRALMKAAAEKAIQEVLPGTQPSPAGAREASLMPIPSKPNADPPPPGNCPPKR